LLPCRPGDTTARMAHFYDEQPGSTEERA
jgi:hypothetical protein